MHELDYTLEFEDLLALYRDRNPPNPDRKVKAALVWIMWLMFAGSCLGTTLTGNAKSLEGAGTIELAVIIAMQAVFTLIPILLLFWSIFGRGIIERSLRSQYERMIRDRGTLATHLHIGPEGIVTSTRHSSSSLDWTLIRNIRWGPDHVFFYEDETRAHVVPKRAFADGEKFYQFIDAACQLRKEALEKGGRLPARAEGETDERIQRGRDSRI